MSHWVLRSPAVLSAFSKLGYKLGDGYHINETCNEGLQTILDSLLSEDQCERPFRRSIGFGQYVQTDLIPILLASTDEKTIELIIKILADLTVPPECLNKTDSNAKYAILEINNMIRSTKSMFTDYKLTKVVIDYLKKHTEAKQSSTLTSEQCVNIGACLLLLRNLLDISGDAGMMPVVPMTVIPAAPTATVSLVSAVPTAMVSVGPEEPTEVMLAVPAVTTDIKSVGPSVPTAMMSAVPAVTTALISVRPAVPTKKMPVVPAVTVPQTTRRSQSAVQKQIIWNIFSHGVDTILLRLMINPEAESWCVTMVQLVELLFKNESGAAVHRLVTEWLETSLEVSDEHPNDSSPSERDSGESSLLLTTESSDSKGKAKEPTRGNKAGEPPWRNLARPKQTLPLRAKRGAEKIQKAPGNDVAKTIAAKTVTKKKEQPKVKVIRSLWEPSFECGCGVAEAKPMWTSSSSDEDELILKRQAKKPNLKHKPNPKHNPLIRHLQKRENIMRRSRVNISKVHLKIIRWPNVDDISQLLKEFALDFLVKGFNALAKSVHSRILANCVTKKDTSHFFWLVSYFLRLTTELELDMDQVNFVLSFEMVSYFTAESVNLLEQFEMAIKKCGCKPTNIMQRQHMLVTAIREFVRAVHMYTQHIQMTPADRDVLLALHEKMCANQQLRMLFVLLLRHYNPEHQTKEYLQDLITVNHNLLELLDIIMKTTKSGPSSIKEHFKQFATVEMMQRYGFVLEDYKSNDLFVNDCVFTLMHHVGGDLDTLEMLFQPNILKTFTNIIESKFVINEDWSDLILYTINGFIRNPRALLPQLDDTFRLKNYTLVMDEDLNRPKFVKRTELKAAVEESQPHEEIWSEGELSILGWHYMQCKKLSDPIGIIMQLYKNDKVIKSRRSVLNALYKTEFISKREYEELAENKTEYMNDPKSINPEDKDNDNIVNLCKELYHDGRGKFVSWVQLFLLDTCFAKIYQENVKRLNNFELERNVTESREDNDYEDMRRKEEDTDYPPVSPVAWRFLLLEQSVPVVPWNCEQAAMFEDDRFLRLLTCLGFEVPLDSDKVFIRVPSAWSAEHLYMLAAKVGFIDESKLNFSLNTKHLPGKPSLYIQSEALGSNSSYEMRKLNICASILKFPPPLILPESPASSESSASSTSSTTSEKHEVSYTEGDWSKIISSCKNQKSLFDIKRDIVMKFEWGGEVRSAGVKNAWDSYHLPIPPLLPSRDYNQNQQKYSATIPICGSDDDADSWIESMCSMTSNMTRMQVSSNSANSSEGEQKTSPVVRRSTLLKRRISKLTGTARILHNVI